VRPKIRLIIDRDQEGYGRIPMPRIINQKTLLRGITRLVQTDSDLAEVVSEFGNPPLWARERGFSTLVHIILEQQVSLASAMAAFTKLRRATNPLTPKRFLEFSSSELREMGFSRQKANYCRELSMAIVKGDLDLDELIHMDDEPARTRLMEIKGIGPWTADIYLLMAMRRSDIWPSGDIALASAVQDVKGLTKRPGSAELERIAESWRPLRAVAARVLWHYYLSKSRQG
jgi:DNA-3-methyladenine glycosylase II